METDLASPPAAAPRRSTAGVALAKVLLWVDALAMAAGLAGLLLGRVWTEPVEMCGGGEPGRKGAEPLWFAITED